MIDEARLNEIEERAEDATPGPWVVGVSIERSWGGAWPVMRLRDMMGIGEDELQAEASANALFVENAREDVPSLIAEVRRQAARIAELEAGDGWTTFYTWQVGEEAEYRIQRRKR